MKKWQHTGSAEKPQTVPLTKTQTAILSRAAKRGGNLAMPLPDGLAGAAAKMTVTKMLERGWLEEIETNGRRGEPLWRETGDGHGTTLIATEAGFAAIGIEPVVVRTMTRLRRSKVTSRPAEVATAAPVIPETPPPIALRPGTKRANIIALLMRPSGATIGEIVEATGWVRHSVRGMISGGLRQKLNLPITTQKDDLRGQVYRIAASI